ncbi:hypothetical protein [Parasitella parasitica]|uniref:Uncharacterized protein n=1 Tax=Parasitella parasitica TaxID=35722 RepID=A0A0B7N0G7_9FUNG|nr:hypothetical protein [Parasitella parasitica]
MAPPPPPSPKGPYKGGLRLFTAVSLNQGFEHLYVPIRGRVPYKTIRSELRLANINSGSIVDIHYPTNKVIELLVHNDYIKKFRSLLLSEGIRCIENFDPYDPKHFADPQFKEATEDERTKQIALIRGTQIHRTLKHFRNPVKLAVAGDFHRKGLISTSFLEDFVSLHPNHANDRPAPQQAEAATYTQPDSSSHASIFNARPSTQDDLMINRSDEDEHMSNNDDTSLTEVSYTAPNSSAGGGDPAHH